MGNQIDRAEKLIQLDAAVPGWLLHRIAGPGNMARHDFRGLPTTFLTGSSGSREPNEGGNSRSG